MKFDITIVQRLSDRKVGGPDSKTHVNSVDCSPYTVILAAAYTVAEVDPDWTSIRSVTVTRAQ